MEASDPFAGGVQAPTDDPFAEKPGEESAFEQEGDPFAENEQAVTDQPVEGRPIVDAEGQEVKNPPTSTTEDATTQVAASTSTQEAPDEETDAEREQRESAEAEADRMEAESRAAMEQQAAAAPAEVAAEPAPATEEPKSEVPEERNEKGETVKRGYRLIAPDGQGKWRDVTWYEDESGKVVEKGAAGAKKVNVATVRGQADALRIGFRAMGSPEGGCSLAAIPAKYFRVRNIAPDIEPQPRQRVKISG